MTTAPTPPQADEAEALLKELQYGPYPPCCEEGCDNDESLKLIRTALLAAEARGAAREREACAKDVESFDVAFGEDCWKIAAAIRARS